MDSDPDSGAAGQWVVRDSEKDAMGPLGSTNDRELRRKRVIYLGFGKPCGVCSRFAKKLIDGLR